MEATVDAGGRILLPKQLRDALGISPGTKVDVSWYGNGIQITVGGRTARLAENDSGRLVAESSTVVDDDAMYALIDSGRR